MRHRSWRGRLTVRTRITLTAALLAATALAGAGALVYALESARIKSDVTAQIEQEVAELRTFQRSAVDPDTGTRIQDPNRLLEVFLTRNVPDDDELLIWYAGAEPRDSSDASTQDTEDLRTRNRYGSLILDYAPFVDTATTLLSQGGTRVLDGTPYGEVWVTGVPVRRATGSGVEGTLVIVNFLLDEHEELHRTMRTYAIVAFLSLGGLTLVAALQAGRLLAPLRTLSDAADDITTTDLTRRIPESGHDDITSLTRTFNGMLDRLDSGFTSQRRFLDDAGHELKTPLTVLRGHLEVLEVDEPGDVAQTRDLLLDEVDRMSRLVGDLILLAKAERPDFLSTRSVGLRAVTTAVLAKASGLGERQWRVDEAAEGVAVLDEQRLTQALLQLADNAVKHTGPGDEIAVGSRVDAVVVRFWVRDTGRGVPVEDRERIFERFGRSAVPRGDEGFGLGLSVVRAIAEAHGGAVHVDGEEPHGARFVVSLPLVRPVEGRDTSARETTGELEAPTTGPRHEEVPWPAS